MKTFTLAALILILCHAYMNIREDHAAVRVQRVVLFCHSFSFSSSQRYNKYKYSDKNLYRYSYLQLAKDSSSTSTSTSTSSSTSTSGSSSSNSNPNGNGSILKNRRDVIMDTTTNAAKTAVTAVSSLILLQNNPSPSLAIDEDGTSTSTSTFKNSISLNSSSSCSSEGSSSTSTFTSKPFPLASFGLQIYDNDKAYKLTTIALQTGYRNFFASVLAGNQKGFAKAIRDSNIPLSDLYICGTVLSNRAVGYKAAYSKTKQGCEENLNIMNQYSNGKIQKLDMIMLDYPALDEESIRGQWDAFQDFQRMNNVNDLALSNFNAKQLDCILVNNDSLCSKPTVNQLPFSIANHPGYMMEENEKRNIHVQSWSPLSTTLPRYRDVMADIGKKYNKNAAQVGLRWIVQSGGSYCVQSQKESHFREDLDVFDFELSEKDMEVLNTLAPPRLLG
mmetsp:Transcript_16015/g.24042  ORF Transcript_16015/g.24042 Transcript_16015/m.24042 type:complete len:446 (+) Transcript_16015:127-1464(+)